MHWVSILGPDRRPEIMLTFSATKKYSDTNCGRTHEDNSLYIIVTTPLFGALALLIWFLRVLSRYMTGFRATWGMDDWIMVPTIVRTIPQEPPEQFQLIMSDRFYSHDMSILDSRQAWPRQRHVSLILQ